MPRIKKPRHGFVLKFFNNIPDIFLCFPQFFLEPAAYEGIILAEGINPFFSDLDTYASRRH